MTPKIFKRPAWFSFRWLFALSGCGFIIFGQLTLSREILPQRPPTGLGAWLNAELHLAIPSIDNILTGLPFLLLGAVLLLIATRGMTLVPAEASSAPVPSIFLPFLRSSWPLLLVGVVTFLLLLWQVDNLEYSHLLVLQWLFALLLIMIAAAMWDQKREVAISMGLQRVDIVWMVGLLIAGIVVSSYRLQGLPDMLMGDEGSFWMIARDIARGEFSPPVFSSGVYTFPVLSSIGPGLAMRLLGTDLWGWRFTSVLSGCLAIVPVYLLAREAFNRKIAVVAGLALVFLPYFLVFTRLGYNNIQSLFITTLALYYLYLGVKRSSYFFLFLAGCASGLGFYTYFAARMALFISVLFIFLLWMVRRLQMKHAAIFLGILLAGSIFVIAPYLIYGIRYDPEGMSYKVFESVFFNTFNGLQFFTSEELTSVAPYFQFAGNELFYNPTIYLVLLVRGLIRTLLIFQKAWLISEHFIAFPLAGTVGVFFYFLGFGRVLKRITEPRNLLLASWFAVTILGLSVLNTVPPRHTHMVSLIPCLAIMVGLGIYLLTHAIISFHRGMTKYTPYLLSLLVAGLAVGGLYDYFFLMPSRYYPQPDQLISWTGLYVEDENLYFIYDDASVALTVQPYVITEFRPDVSYTVTSLGEFTENSQITALENAIFFYPPALDGQLKPILASAWGGKAIFRIFTNQDGVEILAAGMNTPFVFERDRSIGAVLQESYLRPSLWVLLGLLLVILAASAWLPSIRIPRLPRWLAGLRTWATTSAPVLSAEEAPFVPDNLPDIINLPVEEPADPPPWASEVLPKRTREQGKKPSIAVSSVRQATGRDYYLHLHLPRLRLPWQRDQTPGNPEMPPIAFPAPLLLISAALLAIIAQLLVFLGAYLAGIIIYLLAAGCLVWWAFMNPGWKDVLARQVRLPPRAELWIGLVLLAVVIFTRFYDLGYRVYGLEADETKWTVQSWFSTILGVDRGEFAGMHYKFLPVDFWVRSVFLRLFGLEFLSARIESALFGVIAVIFLFLLVRRLTRNPSTALLTAALYAFSFVELNANHQALHNTTLEPWMMAGLYCLVAAVQDEKLWQYQLAGLVLALGMLTYETFLPAAVLGLIWAIGSAFWQVLKRQASLVLWLQRLALLSWPLFTAYLVFLRGYFQSRHGYHFGSLEQLSQPESPFSSIFLFFFTNLRELLQTTFSQVLWQDSLLRWDGSFLNQFLLPFVVLGFLYNLLIIHRPYMAFVPLWYLLSILAAPILLGSVWPRVLYTSLGPLMVWGALGLWVLLAALRSFFNWVHLKQVMPVFLFCLFLILTSDYLVFTRGIDDPEDRVKRRELADLTFQVASDEGFLIYPYFPTHNDSVELESHVLLFSVAGARQEGLEAEQDYLQVPYDQLLMALWEQRTQPRVVVFFDKTAITLQEERQEIINTLLHCYPGHDLQASGRFFDIYAFNTSALLDPLCYQAAAPALVTPADDSELSSSPPISFEWDPGDVQPSGYRIVIEQHDPDIYWIEAEDVFLSNGWYMTSDFVTGFTGTGLVLDNWQSGESTFELEIAEAGDYQVWVRSYVRRYNDQQNYLSLNGQVLNFAGDQVPLDQWYWESLGVFSLPAGKATLALGRVYGQDEMFSVFIDSVMLASDLAAVPSEAVAWETIFDGGEVLSSSSRFLFTQPLSPGTYRWNVRVFDGDRLIDSFGQRGILMPYAYFTIKP